MATFDPLREAIDNVLEDSNDTGCQGLVTVREDLMLELQKQYEAFFVE